MNKDWPRIALGVGVIGLGAVLLLVTLGVLEGRDVLALWPLGVVLGGLAVMARQYGLAGTLISIAVIAGFFSAAFPHFENPGELSVHAYDAPGNGSLGLDLSFVGGELIISDGNLSGLLALSAEDYAEPSAHASSDGNLTVVRLSRELDTPRFGDGVRWDLTLGEAPSTLALDLVATDGDFDLRRVPLKELVINNVASQLDIRLPATNSTVAIDTTASDITISYPEGVGVRVQYDAVASDVSPLGEFAVGHGEYQSIGLENATTSITISVDAVASDVKIYKEDN